MPLLPPRRSPVWLLVLLGSAVLLTAGFLWADSAGTRGVPAQDTVLATVLVSLVIAAVLSALGALGARATYACAMLGLLLGLTRMIWAAVHPNEGMADLAAIASFYMYGLIGLGIGALIDLGRWLGARQRRR